jgi:4-hydroxymandelate oxidase
MTELFTIPEWRDAARARLDKAAWDYFRSGADQQRTLRANRRAYRAWTIWPRVLVDVSAPSLSTTVLGTPVATPILVAPTAYHRLAHPDGELATAAGAADAGSLYVVSTLATTTLEEVAAASTGPKWFQLYVHRDRGLTRSLVERAEAAGYGAIVLTVDTPILGRRLADERNRFTLPPDLTMANLASGVVGITGSGLAAYFKDRHDASLGWRDVEWLRGITRLPLAVKGVLRADDAARAVEAGAAAVIVSNHGGRQLDGAPATLEALPRVVDAVAGRAEVLHDGGIRWGTDALKAIALGARAVLVGRPVLWGLAVGGRAGVARVLTLLTEELARAMALAGCPRLDAVDRTLVERAAR